VIFVDGSLKIAYPVGGSRESHCRSLKHSLRGMVERSKRRDSKSVRRAAGKAPDKENTQMHDLLIALSFVAMVLAPCFVASKSGSSEMEAETI
jgi:hypothetical protein